MVLALVVIVLLVVALGATAYLLVAARRDLDSLRADRDETESRRVATAADLDTLRVRHSDTERDLADRVEQLDAERDRLATTKKRAETAEKALRDLQVRLDEATAKSESVATTLDEVRAELAQVTEQLENAGEGGDAGALWALEIARSERRWQASVAPGMDLPSPFEQTDDALKLAVEVEASALREEVGTRIDVAWALDADLPDQASLLVLRLAQELLADAASRAETLELRVGLEDDSAGVAVALRALDEEGTIVPVALPPLASGRVRPGEDGVWVVTRN
jgi:hypothetical protein